MSILFLKSLAIILREGIEAIIVIAALIAFLIKSNNKDKVKIIYGGAFAGVVASFITAYILEGVLDLSEGKEVLEAIVMLTAVVVLFYVSYWLITKVEIKKWQAFIRGKMENALSQQNHMSLAFVAFFAVYREGFETVLFYKALYSYEKGIAEGGGIFLGFVTGIIILTVIFYVVNKLGRKIPLKPFFMITSLILYYMAFTFMGKGIHELQEAHIIGETVISWVPKIKLIGLYPTVETIMAQMLLVAAFVFALIYSFVIQPAREHADLMNDATHVQNDIAILHDLLNHITLHTKKCQDILGLKNDENLKEIDNHIFEIDGKAHELIDHLKHIENQLTDSFKEIEEEVRINKEEKNEAKQI